MITIALLNAKSFAKNTMAEMIPNPMITEEAAREAEYRCVVYEPIRERTDRTIAGGTT
jgi:hypothetical protein